MTPLPSSGTATAPWRAVNNFDELDAALGDIHYPAVLKTVSGGYDRVAMDHLLSGSLGGVLVRGSLRWGFAPESQLESLAASASWRPSRDLRLSGRLQRTLLGTGTTSVGA